MNNSYEQRWLAIKKLLDDRGVNGSDIVEALQDYYSIFEDRTLKWLAGLFDPDIGGFYYSESARDNDAIVYNGVEYPLLPDIESTSQATNFLHGNEIFKDWMDFPRWMIDKMAKFICERQDPETGFFYHPQWTKELVDSKPSRRGRDAWWAQSMAEKYQFKLPYPTAYERLANKTENANDSIMPEYLLSEEKFIEYLKSFDWDNLAYHSGNRLASQGKLIKAAGLDNVAIDFLNSIQNKKTGTWGKCESGFAAINAYLKISALYRDVNRPIPNSDKALKIVFECATAPIETATSTCCQYNVWFSICNILANMRFFGEDSNKLVNETIAYNLKNCIEPIRSTKEKALRFKKPAGCFSFEPNQSSGTSQGMPVAIFHTNEGDINANGICSSGTARLIFEALGIGEHWVPIFSPEGRDIFMSALKLPKEMQ